MRVFNRGRRFEMPVPGQIEAPRVSCRVYQTRQLDFSSAADFQIMIRHIGVLYVELFGPGSEPAEDSVVALAEAVQAGDVRHWAFVAEQQQDGNAPVNTLGLLTIAESLAAFAHGRYGIINELWVMPRWRSRGVGADLVARAAALGEKRRWRRIDVSAPVSPAWDRSVDFYRQRGFVPTGRKLKLLLPRTDVSPD